MSNYNFTFGIITSGNNDPYLNIIIDSIEDENIPEYEILIIGNTNLQRKNTKVIPFDESIKPAWITKKKNLITKHAKFDNIVYMHDYIRLLRGWYSGFLKFGDTFDVCSNVILNQNGTRYRDWVIAPWLSHHLPLPSNLHPFYQIPYDLTHLTKFQYISGAYWVAKKKVMEAVPLDESRCWGQSEDVFWSHEINKKFNISLNRNSAVALLHFKNRVWEDMPIQLVDVLRNFRYNGEELIIKGI